MKKILPFLPLILMTFLLGSCAVIGGIFKAGVWVGVLLVLIVIGVIVWLVTRGPGKS
ncbi:MAG: phosphatidate cytidylyltransferase [Bacteroidota bacterium]|nr:phosphatidate cytidylyltransferase [Bacteroidota bacterium]MDP4212020.1 phosphatidate cytidylyltransferase [Bacteroidota bacterium]MDP4249956.1 phosphatidate cytidylyltransferase [Bacteroidota bacterium]